MKKFYFLMALFMLLGSSAFAETKDSEFALFKRNISPAMMWGEDGLMLVPKANTMGKGNIYASANVLDAGQIQNQKLFLTSGSVMLSTSEDVELGYTKRVFVWDDGDYTNIEMDTYHLKARIFHLADNYIPQVAVGVNLVSVAANDFSDQKDILYNPYAVATIRIPVGTEQFVLTATGVVETVYNEGETTEVMFSGGADIRILENIYLLAEIQGVNKDGKNGIINAGAKIKLGWFSIGAGMFNISRESIENKDDNKVQENGNSYWMANVSFEIPFNKLFK
jgi:hypothetical protein